MFIDSMIILLTLWGGYQGWKSGLVKQIVNLSGFLVGLFIAATMYSWLGKYLVNYTNVGATFTNVLAFLLLWIIVPIFLGFVANVLTKGLKLIFLGLPNQVLGMAVGIAKFWILLSCLFNIMSLIGLTTQERVSESHLYPFIKGLFANYFTT